MDKIKLGIVEDDLDWLKVMEAFISSNTDLELVGSATSRAEAMELVMSKDIDVLIMDINLNGKKSDGIFCVLDILEKKNIKIVMMTSLRDKKVILDSFTAGAVDYILKENFYDLPYVVRRVHSRSSTTEALLCEFRRLKKENQFKDFSPAEMEIFGYVEKGYNKTQIESATFKTKSTIKHQIRSILKKLNVKSRQEAIKKVHSNGLLEESIDPQGNENSIDSHM